MKYYKVTIEVHIDDKKKERKVVAVEAGNKRLASLRAMSELVKQGFGDYFKTLVSVEEV